MPETAVTPRSVRSVTQDTPGQQVTTPKRVGGIDEANILISGDLHMLKGIVQHDHIAAMDLHRTPCPVDTPCGLDEEALGGVVAEEGRFIAHQPRDLTPGHVGGHDKRLGHPFTAITPGHHGDSSALGNFGADPFNDGGRFPRAPGRDVAETHDLGVHRFDRLSQTIGHGKAGDRRRRTEGPIPKQGQGRTKAYFFGEGVKQGGWTPGWIRDRVCPECT